MSDQDLSFTALDPASTEYFQPLRRELGVTSFGINVITLQPRQRMRVHSHERQEEVYLVLEGALTLVTVHAHSLTLVTEDDERLLGRHELARVGPAVRRQLVNRGPERAVVLALGGSNEHAGRDGRAWASWDEEGPGRPPQEVPMPEDLPPA